MAFLVFSMGLAGSVVAAVEVSRERAARAPGTRRVTTAPGREPRDGAGGRFSRSKRRVYKRDTFHVWRLAR
jgi:hypothetical protein